MPAAAARRVRLYRRETPKAGVHFAGRALSQQEFAVRTPNTAATTSTSFAVATDISNTQSKARPSRRAARHLVASSPVARKLPGDAPAARAALQRPLQGLAPHRFVQPSRDTMLLQPITHDSPGTRPDRTDRTRPTNRSARKEKSSPRPLAGMDLLADILRLQVFAHVLGHQVAAIRCCVDQDIVGRRRNRAVEHGFQ